MEKIQNVTRVLLLIWFVVISFFILVPSFFVLLRVRELGAQAQPQPPTPPQPPELPPLSKDFDKDVQGKQIESRVSAYQHQVAAYSHLMGAYKSQLDAQGKPSQLAVYQTVVKETLVSLITGLLTALVGYVFVTEGAKVAKEVIQANARERPAK